MKKKILTVLAAVSLVLVALPTAQAASVNAHGQCFSDDDHSEGGGGSVGASSNGSIDAVNASEAVSVASGAVQLVNGTASNPSGDACPNTDDDDDDGVEEDEDHIFVGASAGGSETGICVDNDGTQLHNGTHDDCHTNA